MANRIPEEGTRFSDPNDINSQVREYVKLKASINSMEARQKELRDKILDYVDQNGDEETSGSFSLYLDEDIDGVCRVQKTRRVKRTLNEELADSIIEQAGIAEDVYEWKRIINEDNLMAAFYNEQITEEQLDAMFPPVVSWALNTLKK